MDCHQKSVVEARIAEVIRRLEQNNMAGYYVPTAAEVPARVAALLHEGDTVAVGGSATLSQTGVIDLLRQGPYRFLDRYAPGLSGEEVRRIFIESFDADAYICSANAVTMRGELYNVDGNSNRVAAIAFGPRSVILVVGCNKIVRDVDAAAVRVKQQAAPSNAARLSCATPCAKTGRCAGLDGGMIDGCGGDSRICCSYLISARQREKNRIKVLLVGEELGY